MSSDTKELFEIREQLPKSEWAEIAEGKMVAASVSGSAAVTPFSAAPVIFVPQPAASLSLWDQLLAEAA